LAQGHLWLKPGSGPRPGGPQAAISSAASRRGPARPRPGRAAPPPPLSHHGAARRRAGAMQGHLGLPLLTGLPVLSVLSPATVPAGPGPCPAAQQQHQAMGAALAPPSAAGAAVALAAAAAAGGGQPEGPGGSGSGSASARGAAPAAGPASPQLLGSQLQALLLQHQQQQLLQQMGVVAAAGAAAVPPPPVVPQQPQILAPQTAFQAAQASYEQSSAATIDTEVTELAHHFKLDERITKDLDIQMKRRNATFEEDMKALYEILEGARNPAGLLRVKIREMEDGNFRGTATPDRGVEDLSRKYGLDAQASAKLAEVLAKREDKEKDLRMLAKHIELSNKPSSLVMLMLKDLRAGVPLKDPEYPAAVGSYAHKRGLKRGSGRSRSRGRGETRRRRHSSSSSSPPRREHSPRRSSGAGPLPGQATCSGAGPRPQTLLERFG